MLLKNVNRKKLLEYLLKSILISEHNVLNFKITADGISSTASNAGNSLFKQWHLPMEEFCDGAEGGFKQVKVSIYNSKGFIAALKDFEGNVDLDFAVNDAEASICKIVDERNKIPVACSPSVLHYVDYPADTLSKIFTPDQYYESTPAASFKLSANDIKKLVKLGKLKTNEEQQQGFISIYSEDGWIVATDGSIERKLYADANTILPDGIRIGKPVLAQLCDEDIEFDLHNTNDGNIIVGETVVTSTLVSCILVEDLQEIDFTLDEVDKEFSWDIDDDDY